MKVKSKSKVKVEGEERKAKPKMTAEQKACLAACKSFDADVERAKYIDEISNCVLRDMCKTCDNQRLCEKDGPVINCRMVAIASVAVGIIQEGGVK